MSENTYAVELRGISKNFGHVQVLRQLDLDVRHGEILALLGPSGCGKSTTLNIIAGFFAPDEGHIYLDSEPVDRVPTHRRNLGMVFQSYSLFPHQTIASNVGFGLSVRGGMKAAEIEERVMWALSLVRLPDVADRFPAQLSGGQQQRVAVARALVVDPKVMLLDEPLSNLDARLRKELQVELKRIQNDTGVTMVYVTHDQEEAVTLADRIALMRDGIIEQLDNPKEIFEFPQTRYAAHFMGFSNFFSGVVEREQGDELLVKLPGDYVVAVEKPEDSVAEEEVTLAIREERITIESILPPDDGDVSSFKAKYLSDSKDNNRLIGRIEEMVYTGGHFVIFIDCEDGLQLQARVPVQQLLSTPPAPEMLANVILPKDDLRIVEEA